MRKVEKKRKKKPQHRQSESPPSTSLVQSALFGSLCGLISSVLLLLIVSFVCYRASDPDFLLWPLSLGALYLSCLVAGFAAIKRRRADALLCGGLSGLCLGVFFFVLSLFLRRAQSPSLSLTLSLLLRALMVVFSGIGGFLGLGKHKKRHS